MYSDPPVKTINLPEFQIHAPAGNVVNNVKDLYPAGISPTDAPVPKPDAGGASYTPAALAILSIAAQVGANIWTTYKQHEYQLEYMDKSQKQALERWAKENAYNDPKAVMARLQRSGLNPNLVFGNAGVGTSGSIDAVSAPEAYATNPMNGVGGIIQAMQQAQLTQSQIELNEANAERAHSDASKNESEVDVMYKKLDVEYKRLADDIERNVHLNGLSDAEVKSIKAGIIETFVRCAEMAHHIGEMDAHAAQLNADAALKKVQSSTWRAEANARIKELSARAGMEEKQAAKFAEETTDIIETRSARIAAIQKSNEETQARTDKINKEIAAMQQDINAKSHQIISRVNYDDQNGADKFASFLLYNVIDYSTSQIGRIFGVSVGHYTTELK